MSTAKAKKSEIGAAILEMLFPQHCALCGKESPDSICLNCFQIAFMPITNACVRCGREMQTEYDSPDCGACHSEKYSFKRAISLYSYADPGRSAFLAAKFGSEKPSLGTAIAKAAARRLSEETGGRDERERNSELTLQLLRMLDFAVDVPVIRPYTIWDAIKNPIEILKPGARKPQVNRRNYNFSLVFAHFAAKSLDIPHISGALLKVKDIPSQVGLSPSERRLNVRGAFSANNKFESQIKGASILLIDDLFTTGATASECALTLKRAGAKMVIVLTLFSTPPKPETRGDALYELPNFDDDFVPPPFIG